MSCASFRNHATSVSGTRPLNLCVFHYFFTLWVDNKWTFSSYAIQADVIAFDIFTQTLKLLWFRLGTTNNYSWNCYQCNQFITSSSIPSTPTGVELHLRKRPSLRSVSPNCLRIELLTSSFHTNITNMKILCSASTEKTIIWDIAFSHKINTTQGSRRHPMIIKSFRYKLNL